MGQDLEDHWVTQDALFEALKEHGINEERAAALLSQLVRTKIVDETSDGEDMRYRIAIPLLRTRLVRQNLYLKYFR
jgi:hypothetical protein